MSTKLNIKLNIAGNSYPLSIDSEKEEKYRRAEKDINELVTKYQTRFRASKEMDYLAMAALQLSVSNVEAEMSRSLGEDRDALVEIDKELDEYLNSLK